MNKKKKIISVVGARPNFMKVAPISRELEKYSDRFQHLIVHTGQHYDENMSKIFFEDLAIPMPDINLGVGPGNHGEQTGKIMIEFEKICLAEKPDLVLVYGDVNSTIAAALVSVKLGIRVAHVEAGLRSFDRSMPEEINRVLTDSISDYLFTPSPDGDENLLKEGVSKEKIYMVGDIMVDSLLFNKGKAAKLDVLSSFGLSAEKYAVLTLHRPSNVDNEENIKNIFAALEIVSEKIPIIFPIHPRTKKMMQKFNINQMKGLKLISPLGYLEFLNLMMNCSFMLTDSGGIQEETTVLDIPCLTLRNTTERPITLSHGTNMLVSNNTDKIIKEAKKILDGGGKKGNNPDLWDGQTARRIINILLNLSDK
ncbi:MAG: UDP-N-acetylglucosamine 2-epimerase (non-hydrolyzing) [Candidatus Margulisbacteria bacterium]|nr:UDP-N-acetylglucosamine 2-epimerase (non-hydrolyzing) [Candidatus Margulisiibacteriota bacterium]